MFGLALLVTAWVPIRATQIEQVVIYWATIGVLPLRPSERRLPTLRRGGFGMGYTGGSLLLLGLVLLSLFMWKVDAGRISADIITSRKSEVHYWVTITFSQTLGTALGDWFADTAGLGYAGSTAVFTVVLAIIAALYFTRRGNPVLLFWAAFIIRTARSARSSEISSTSPRRTAVTGSAACCSPASCWVLMYSHVPFGSCRSVRKPATRRRLLSRRGRARHRNDSRCDDRPRSARRKQQRVMLDSLHDRANAGASFGGATDAVGALPAYLGAERKLSW